MFRIHWFSQRFFLLVFTATICVLFITRKPNDYKDYENNFLDSETPVNYTNTKRLHVPLRNVTYSANSAPRCNFQSPYLLILVHSGPAHFVQRSTIRKTWGSASNILGHSVRVLFLLGETDGPVGSKLSYEMKESHDIVKGSFRDSYRNLTYKHVLGYKWFLENCERASVVMKVDDDVFVDVFRAIHVLTKTFGTQPTNLLAGLVGRSVSVLREGKWSVPRKEYPFDVYPEYLSGFAYFVTPDVARRMYAVVESVPFFWIDDVFVTGFVANAAGVMKTDLSVRFQLRDGFLIRWLLGKSTQPCPWIASTVEQSRWPQDVIRLWNKTVKAWGVNSLTVFKFM